MLLAPTWIITTIQLLTCCTAEVTKISFAISKKKVSTKKLHHRSSCTSCTCSEEGGGGMLVFSVCEAPSDDWANCGFVDVFFTYGEYGFSSIGI